MQFQSSLSFSSFFFSLVFFFFFLFQSLSFSSFFFLILLVAFFVPYKFCHLSFFLGSGVKVLKKKKGYHSLKQVFIHTLHSFIRRQYALFFLNFKHTPILPFADLVLQARPTRTTACTRAFPRSHGRLCIPSLDLQPALQEEAQVPARLQSEYTNRV